MEKILDDMRRDAVMRAQTSETEKKPLKDAIDTIVKFARIVRKEGMSALEKERNVIGSGFLKLLVTMFVDMSSPELVIEIATDIYWTDEPEGVQALVYYIYLKGMLLIYEGNHPGWIEQSLQYLYDPRYLWKWDL